MCMCGYDIMKNNLIRCDRSEWVVKIVIDSKNKGSCFEIWNIFEDNGLH